MNSESPPALHTAFERVGDTLGGRETVIIGISCAAIAIAIATVCRRFCAVAITAAVCHRPISIGRRRRTRIATGILLRGELGCVEDERILKPNTEKKKKKKKKKASLTGTIKESRRKRKFPRSAARSHLHDPVQGQLEAAAARGLKGLFRHRLLEPHRHQRLHHALAHLEFFCGAMSVYSQRV